MGRDVGGRGVWPRAHCIIYGARRPVFYLGKRPDAHTAAVGRMASDDLGGAATPSSLQTGEFAPTLAEPDIKRIGTPLPYVSPPMSIPQRLVLLWSECVSCDCGWGFFAEVHRARPPLAAQPPLNTPKQEPAPCPSQRCQLLGPSPSETLAGQGHFHEVVAISDLLFSEARGCNASIAGTSTALPDPSQSPVTLKRCLQQPSGCPGN